MADTKQIQTIVTQIIEQNVGDEDLRWVLLAQSLDPERSPSKEPIIRKQELQEMVSLALNSQRAKFRDLVFTQLALQMKFKGSKEYIVSKQQSK